MTVHRKTLVLRIALAAVSLVLIMIIIAATVHQRRAAEQAQQGYPGYGGDFVLQSADGSVALKDYRGKVVVLYFGFTFCPDVCPTSLAVLSLALKELTQAELDDLQVFFISLDPERDTPERLKAYGKSFHPKIIGLTGTPAEIKNVAGRYGVLYMKVDMPGSAMKYSIDHSSRFYVINRKGVLSALIYHGSEVKDIAEQLRQALH
jgi:protein SCO1/2